mmetsp:Transcript_40664/g.96576  ORF Transcript_40664/g.96576 Transcript_40664/m.96576 type:complete len:970 (+) Transcript_40664:96-3005(+)
MGTSNSTPVDQTENGPYYNQYWRARTRDADWELREALLDGDKQTVCALLGIDSEQPGLFERLATPISKSDRTRQIAALKPLQELVLTSHRWNDDRGQTAYHYLAFGRRNHEQAKLMTNFPIVGAGARAGAYAEGTEGKRAEIVNMLALLGRLDPMSLMLKNELKGAQGGVTPLHLAVQVGSLVALRPALAMMSPDIKTLLAMAQSKENSSTALHYACKIKDEDVRARMLHEVFSLVPLDKRGELLQVQDGHGYTALHYAVVNGSLNGLRSELESLSADAMARLAMAKSVETGGTALHFAVGHADEQVRLKMLQEVIGLVAADKRAQLLEAKDGDSNTIMDDAVLHGHTNIFRLLFAICKQHTVSPFGNLTRMQEKVTEMLQLIDSGGLGGSGICIGDRMRVISTGKMGVVMRVEKKVVLALDGSKPGSEGTQVERTDVEHVEDREGSSGWGWGMSGKVKVIASDEERVGLVLAREKSLARRLGVEEAEASTLLQQNAFQLDQAEMHYRTNVTPQAPQAAPVNGPDCTCMVCYDEVSPAERAQSIAVSRLSCKHFTCNDCMSGHARVRLDEGRLHLLVCPREACPTPISADAVHDLFSAEPDLIDRYKMLVAKGSVDESETAWWCPGVGCGRSIEIPPDITSFSVAVTCECGTRFCTGCRKLPHEPAPCKAWEAFDEELKMFEHNNEAANDEWKRLNTTPCKFCNAPVERISGCNHMTCTACNREFCYACGDAWRSSHYGCARPEAPDNPSDANSGESGVDPKVLNRHFCISTYQRWELMSSHREEGWYTELCEQMGYTVAQEVLEKLHKTILRASRVMACSFAIDFSIPDTIRYLQARKTLRELRGALEAALYPAVVLLQQRRDAVTNARDRHTKVMLCHTVETSPDVQRELATATLVIRKRAARLVSASRVGLMACPTSTPASIAMLIGDGVQDAQMKTARAFRSVGIVLGILDGPKKNRPGPAPRRV